MDSIKFVVFFCIGSIVALALQVYLYSPISPDILILPTQPTLLDAIVHHPPFLYITTSCLLFCRFEPTQTRVIEAWQARAHPIKSHLWFADEVIEGKDGSLYFSIPSTKFSYKSWFLDVYEARPHGQLLKYDPKTKQVSLLLDNLASANGVALSKEEDYLLVCETWKFRCLKYWLTGDLQGKTDVFIDNLPGAPDNINLAPDGSFWIAQLQLTAKEFNFVHTSKIAKHIIATFPKLIEIMQSYNKHTMVVKVSEDGKILAKYEDPTGKVNRFVTSAMEYEGNLYIGSLHANFIGKLPLPKQT